MKTLTLSFFLLIISYVNSQVTIEDVTLTSINPTAIAFNGDDLYISHSFEGLLSKTNLNVASPNTEAPLFLDLDIPVENMNFYNDELYFVELGNIIRKIDVNSSNPTPVIVSNNLDVVANGLADIVFNGSHLYASDIRTGKIFKADLAGTTLPVNVEEFVNLPYMASRMTISNNNLYIATDEFTGDEFFTRVYKIDLTNPTPTPEQILKIDQRDIILSGLAVLNNKLYMTYLGGSLLVMDLSTPNQFDIVTSDIGPNSDLLLKNNEFYIVNNSTSKIIKVNLEALSVDEVKNKENFRLHPNPSTKFISISGITQSKKYSIYNILGSKIMDGIISSNEREDINIQNFHNGTYFIKFDDGKTLKFVKK